MNSNWSYSPETAKLGCDLCDLDLWPWPFAWMLPWSLVITPENFMMIQWWEHSQKGVTDILEKTQMYCNENRWWFFCLLRIIQENGVYQLGVPQGQGDSSAPSTTDPLISGLCLVTTPNTRGKTVEQSIVTWMFARKFITNCHPVAPQTDIYSEIDCIILNEASCDAIQLPTLLGFFCL